MFVTAPGLDHKAFNYILLPLRDWEFGASDWLNLVTTKNAYNLERIPADTAADFSKATTTKPAVPTNIENAWADAAIADIEAFTRNAGGMWPDLFVLVDSEGVESQTCIFAEALWDVESEPSRRLDAFEKMRVPWSEAYAMDANVSLGNLRFEHWADGGGDDGSTTRERYAYVGLGRDAVGVGDVEAIEGEIEGFRAGGMV